MTATTPGALALDFIREHGVARFNPATGIGTWTDEACKAIADAETLISAHEASEARARDAEAERDKLFKLYEDLGDKYRPLASALARRVELAEGLADALDASLSAVRHASDANVIRGSGDRYIGTMALGVASLAAWREREQK